MTKTETLYDVNSRTKFLTFYPKIFFIFLNILFAIFFTS
ncbi:hypothetical protein B4109_3171 [Geobacillus stearothermophilus]|uniref:Uncharacterized protein n=1 Tax=Geobacillus stearothermophilus TaxID=1422 RepID=A0A150MMC9_GEOSE|nr:hypothetical protein B4109_3171 [Geobacillus stearothermophilus]